VCRPDQIEVLGIDVEHFHSSFVGTGDNALLVHNEPDGVVKPADASEHEPIFLWGTLKEVGPQELKYQDRTVPGKIFEVELTSGANVHVWCADNGEEYFCHGLTFRGKEAPGGVISPLGDHVPTILRGHYESIPEAQARAGDILVWHGASANDVIHSAILTDPIIAPGKEVLDYAARLQTKNGILPEATMTLGQLIESYYGESYQVYRRRVRETLSRSKDHG
jgi:hypothetical protein